MSQFARISDIWKSFWQALEEEVLAMGGSAGMLERLAKGELRPAVRELAKALVGLATPCTLVAASAPVAFDVQKAQSIWKSGVLWENPQLPYCTFTLQNALNQTKLIVGISHMSNQVQVEVDLVTLDCPTLHQSKNQPHQHLMHLALRAIVIGGVEYHNEQSYVEFVLKPVPGMNHRRLCIYDGGKLVFTDW